MRHNNGREPGLRVREEKVCETLEGWKTDHIFTRGDAGPGRNLLFPGRTRLRPILLTPMTTVPGLMGISFQTKGQAAFPAPMAISIVWGLAFATIFTLLLVPSVFAVAEDLILVFKLVFKRKQKKSGA